MKVFLFRLKVKVKFGKPATALCGLGGQILFNKQHLSLAMSANDLEQSFSLFRIQQWKQQLTHGVFVAVNSFLNIMLSFRDVDTADGGYQSWSYRQIKCSLEVIDKNTLRQIAHDFLHSDHVYTVTETRFLLASLYYNITIVSKQTYHHVFMFLLTRFSYLLVLCCIAFVSCFLPFWRHTSETCYRPSC